MKRLVLVVAGAITLAVFLGPAAALAGNVPAPRGRFELQTDVELRQGGYLLTRPGLWLARAWGNSMYPAFPKDAYIWVAPVAWESIEVGDIILWDQTGCDSQSGVIPLLAHEVWIKGSAYLFTKGIANSEPDWCLVYPAMVRGRVLGVMR